MDEGIRVTVNGLEYKNEMGVSSTFDEVSSQVQMYEAEPIEISVTPWPACLTCTFKPKVVKMVDENEAKVDPVNLDEELKKKIDRVLEDSTIEDLQTILNEKITELEGLKKEKEDSVKKSGDVIGKLKKELEDKEKVTQDLEKRVKSLEDNLSAEKRKPFIEELKELDTKKIFDDEDIAAMSIDKIKSKCAVLKEQEKEKEVVSKIKVTSLEQSIDNNVKKVESEGGGIAKKLDFLEMPEEELLKYIDPATEYGRAIIKARKLKKSE